MGLIGFTLKALNHTTGMNKIPISFSPYHNFMKLVTSTGAGEPNLKLLDGLRVISTLFVILGHCFTNSISLKSYANQLTMFQIITKPFLFGFVPTGFFAVDAFFFLSGFLCVHSMVKKKCIFFLEWIAKLNFGDSITLVALGDSSRLHDDIRLQHLALSEHRTYPVGGPQRLE